MYKTNQIHGRRASSIATYEKKAIEKILDEPATARRNIKGDSRNYNTISNIYGRRSESVTSNVEKTYKRIQFNKEDINSNFTPKIYSVAFKNENGLHPKLRRMQSKQSMNPPYASQINKDTLHSLNRQTMDKLREELKFKDLELNKLNSTLKTVEDHLRPLNYSINSLNLFIKEYQDLHSSHISMSKEIKLLKDKCTEAEQQLKFYESMEQTKHHKSHKKAKLNTTKKTTFEKIESLLSNLNISLYQLNDVVSCPEFYECVLSVKVEKEAEEIANQNDKKKAAISHYSDNADKDVSADGSKQRIEIGEQTIEYLKKSADEQVDSIKSGYGEMRDCWKLYYSFMRTFLEIYAGDSESIDSGN